MASHQQAKVTGHKKWRVLTVGMTGSGKSTFVKCMTQEDTAEGAGTKMIKNTNQVQQISHDYGDYLLNMYDTEGFEGSNSFLGLLKQTVRQLAEVQTEFDMVIICIPVFRFTTIDDDFVQFLKKHTSEHFKKVAHVMLTHCTEKSFEENKQTAITKLDFIDEIADRLHRMYLPEPSDFIIVEQLRQEERRVRTEMLEVIQQSKLKLRTTDILRPQPSWFSRWFLGQV